MIIVTTNEIVYNKYSLVAQLVVVESVFGAQEVVGFGVEVVLLWGAHGVQGSNAWLLLGSALI